MAIDFYFDSICNDINNFDCGHRVFNDYLLHDDDISVIHYVLDVNSDELIAYFALATSALLVGDPSDLKGSPAIELKMFALDKKYRGSGLAQSLLEKIVDLIIYYSSNYIGAEAILLYSVPVDHVLLRCCWFHLCLSYQGIDRSDCRPECGAVYGSLLCHDRKPGSGNRLDLGGFNRGLCRLSRGC